MTLYAPDGLLMIAMERFEGLTSSVDCKGDDGAMSLTFQSKNAFDYALQEWKFINENDNGKFLLIANHAGCGPEDQRQPYLFVSSIDTLEVDTDRLHRISNVAEDVASLTTHLTAHTAPWSDVARSYDMDFGHAIPFQRSQPSKRSLWGDIVNVGKDVLNTVEGNADLTKSVAFDMSVGQQGQKTNIYTDSDGRLTLDCVNCFVTGSFGVTGHLSVQHLELQDLTRTASPSNILAELELEAVVTSSDKPDSLQYSKELFSFPIPDAGVEVDGIFKLGATLSYDIGVSSTFAGSATLDFGLQASLPNSAQLVADVQNPDQSSATGWGEGQLTPIFDIKQESASITLSAFSQPKLAFGIELTGVGNVDVAVTIKLPEVSVVLSAEFDEGGVCAQTAGSSQTGVKLDSKVDIELDLQVDVKFGADEAKQSQFRPSWSKKLFGPVEIPLESTCFPLDIPGLGGKVNATSTSASHSSIAAAAVVTSAVASAPSALGIPDAGKKAAVQGSESISNPSPSTTSSSYASIVSSAASSVSISPDAGKHAAVVKPKPATSSSISPPANQVNDNPIPTSISSPPPKAAETPSTTLEAVTTSSSSISAAVASSTSSAASGGGGCRMVKRFGKRMLIC